MRLQQLHPGTMYDAEHFLIIRDLVPQCKPRRRLKLLVDPKFTVPSLEDFLGQDLACIYNASAKKFP